MDITRTYVGSAGPQAPCIYLIDAPEHPTPLEECCAELACSVVGVAVADWGASLTPWPAPALYREEPDYAGGAAATLQWLVHDVMPQAEAEAGLRPRARALAGYSLAGLFSLYAFLHDERFAAVGCLSGSLWYDGWLEHVRELNRSLAGRYGFFSLGSKERRASRPQLKQVQERTEACVALLRERGLQADFVLNPGGHLARIDERTAAGLRALDDWLKDRRECHPNAT